MAEITKELGRIPVSRGDYQATVEYYKDNIVQYKRGSYQVVSESPIVGVPPTNDKNIVNPGWTLFAGTLDAQDVVNQVKEQEARSIQAIADREAEILTKSDAAKVSFDNTGTSLSRTNMQDALEEIDSNVTELDSKLIKLTGFGSSAPSAGATKLGDIYYQNVVKKIRKLTNLAPIEAEDIPFADGAIYSCYNNLYIWDGSDLVLSGGKVIGSASNDITHLFIEWTSGGVFYDNGEIGSASTLAYSNFVNISNLAGQKVDYTKINLDIISNFGIAFYDINKKYISGIQLNILQSERKYSKETIIIPSNAYYIRATKFADTTQYGDFSMFHIWQSITDEVNNNRLITLPLQIEHWASKKGVNYENGDITTAPTSSLSNLIDIRKFVHRKMIYTNTLHTSSSAIVGMCFYTSNGTFIKGVKYGVSSEISLSKEVIVIPENACFVRFSCATSLLEDFYANIELASSQYYDGIDNDLYTDEQCLSKFIDAMNEKCGSLGITSQTIGGPSGYGNGGDMSYMNIYDVIKLVVDALRYEDIVNIWGYNSKTFTTKNIVKTITAKSSLYNNSLHDNLTTSYNILGWKSGSFTPLHNLVCVATSPSLDGRVIAGCVSCQIDGGDTASKNRYDAMKYLLDIGVAKLNNRDADTTSLESLMLGQGVVSSAVIVLPQYAFLHHIDIANDDYINLYSYNPTTINTMSMIKLLTAITMLDCIKDIEQSVYVKEFDITSAIGGSSPLFEDGELVKYKDLLTSLLLPSSNQAGYTIARCVGNYLLVD